MAKQTTVLHALQSWAQAAPESPAQRYKVDNEWKTITAQEYLDRLFYVATYLDAQGLSSESTCAVLAYNSPEWMHMELGTILQGRKSCGLYPNSTIKDIHYVLEHTEAEVLSVQNKEYFQKVVGTDGSTPLPSKIKLVVVFDGNTSIHPGAVSYATVIEEGKRLSKLPGAKTIDQYLDKLDPRGAAFMIYTSGTTGNPKGALLSNDNFIFTAEQASEWLKLPKGRGRTMSFLPLCHVAEKIQNIGVALVQRYCVSFATKFENVSVELVEVQPEVLLCVPRLWEKMMEGVQYKLSRAPAKKRKLAEWALGVGARIAEAKYEGRSPALADRLQWAAAQALVINKIRHALGLGNAEVIASGAAALGSHITKWFRSLGLEIIEDFGQTESTGVICLTEPGVESAGTVGKPLPGTEFKLAEDGEILTRGRHVFLGYFKDAESTASTLKDGWLHTGDLGAFNERGQVKIAGRKKEVLKTSGGKMVSPLPIEEKLKAVDIISQVCMVGDGRKYLSALITLTDSKLGELKTSGAINGGLVLKDDSVLKEVRSAIDELNEGLASYAQIKKFTVLSREFSIDSGEMTPTLKMKRNVIEKNFGELIEQMYG